MALRAVALDRPRASVERYGLGRYAWASRARALAGEWAYVGAAARTGTLAHAARPYFGPPKEGHGRHLALALSVCFNMGYSGNSDQPANTGGF